MGEGGNPLSPPPKCTQDFKYHRKSLFIPTLGRAWDNDVGGHLSCGTHTHTPRSQHQRLTWQECQNFGMNLLLTAQNMPFRDRWGWKRDGPSHSAGLGPVRGILGPVEDGDHINVGKTSLEGCSTQGEGCQPNAKPPSIPFLTFLGWMTRDMQRGGGNRCRSPDRLPHSEDHPRWSRGFGGKNCILPSLP